MADARELVSDVESVIVVETYRPSNAELRGSEDEGAGAFGLFPAAFRVLANVGRPEQSTKVKAGARFGRHRMPCSYFFGEILLAVPAFLLGTSG